MRAQTAVLGLSALVPCDPRYYLPIYVKTRFKDFYRDMFDQQVKKADMHAVFTEYA